MNNSITFATLRTILGDLGFVETPVQGPHVVYEHTPSGVVLVFRPHRHDEKVDQATMAAVRKHLVENGILDHATLENLLLQKAGESTRIATELRHHQRGEQIKRVEE